MHSLEFIGFGLWLSSWAIYAKDELNWNEATIGLSFAIIAFSGFAIVPLLNKFLKEELKLKMILGLLFLAFEPFAVVMLRENVTIVWLSFVIGGIGGTLYFSSFHSTVSTTLEKGFTALFYGILGTFNFLGQAIGNALGPVLRSYYGYSHVILIDSVVLVLVALLYAIFFYWLAKSKEKI